MTLIDTPPQEERVRSRRFDDRREGIIRAALRVLNRNGFKGMTFADVATRVGLNTSSVVYYFKTKESLALACFENGFERMRDMVAVAAQQPTAADRIRCLIQLHFDVQAKARSHLVPPIVIFSDIRSLGPEYRGPMDRAFLDLIGAVARLFSNKSSDPTTDLGNWIRAHLLLEHLFWSIVWTPHYDIEDLHRASEQLFDVIAYGLPVGMDWTPALPDLPPVEEGDEHREAFLRAATDLINERGYRGASVNEISARLNVTKGAFYHHNTNKDDVVVNCFVRSFETIKQAQLGSRLVGGNQWQRIAGVTRLLVARQMSTDAQILRTSALQVLPEALRTQMIYAADRVSHRFLGMISDGEADGSIRQLDPFIAAQVVSASINASADLSWIKPRVDDAVGDLYCRLALMGLLSEAA